MEKKSLLTLEQKQLVKLYIAQKTFEFLTEHQEEFRQAIIKEHGFDPAAGYDNKEEQHDSGTTVSAGSGETPVS